MKKGVGAANVLRVVVKRKTRATLYVNDVEVQSLARPRTDSGGQFGFYAEAPTGAKAVVDVSGLKLTR